jgi:hypothetical protein
MRRDYTPNCAITLYYYRGDPAQAVSSSFSYYCTDCSQGWNVQTNGSIHPPSKQRIVQIRLDAFPLDELEGPAMFAGFRMNLMDAPLKDASDSYWTPEHELHKLGVKIHTPRYPKKNSKTWKTLGPLLFDMTGAKGRLAYTLAVSVGGSEPDWDDPKIYDDGSQ